MTEFAIMLTEAATYDELYRNFRWDIPCALQHGNRVLRPGFAASDELAREIQEFVKVQFAAHEYPRFVLFAETLPMTATGKVLRRELRALG